MKSSRRIGLLFRGDRSGPPLVGRAQVLSDAFEALDELGVAAEPVVYSEDAVDEVREQLRRLDGVLVWVNPIQDGANRAQLDALLREVSESGVWVSAHPEVTLKMGTKEVLHRTRTLSWATDTDLYTSPEMLAERFPGRLGRDGVRVLKQGRGNGGNGVWKVTLLEPEPTPYGDAADTRPTRADQGRGHRRHDAWLVHLALLAVLRMVRLSCRSGLPIASR